MSFAVATTVITGPAGPKNWGVAVHGTTVEFGLTFDRAAKIAKKINDREASK